jgi:hypothetical protein
VIMMMNNKDIVEGFFGVVTLHSLVGVYQRFGGKYSLHLQVRSG